MVKRARGPAGFEAFYRARYEERWPTLRQALSNSVALPGEGRVVRENRHASAGARGRFFEDARPGPVEGSFVFSRDRSWDGRDEHGLRLGYVMDPASILAARALPLSGMTRVLDLCAAPGGKSLVLSEALSDDATLVVNDRSPARRKRLGQVLADYVPAEVRERIELSGYDGRRVGLARPAHYDAILLDAPCSSEAHVLADDKALADWSSGRVERLAKDQYALVTAALGALRPGGVLVYSTCALSPEENDGVLQRLIDKGRHPVAFDPLEFDSGEATEYGHRFLPDIEGFGPIFVARLRKPE